jgi:hypothetical protein
MTNENLKRQVTITAEGIVWVCILGNIQLALRHPKNKGASAVLARQAAAQLVEALNRSEILTDDEAAQIYRDEMRHGPQP